MMAAMARLSSAEVFTPTSFPTHTYVARDELHHERLLREWMRSSTQVASIAGPSKAGKTVLVQRVVGEGHLITVSGGSVRTPDQLWERVLDWWGEPHSVVASTSDTTTGTRTSEKAGTLGVAPIGITGSARTTASAATASAETLQATSQRRGLPQVVQLLANTPYTILLDDFHYIPPAIQADVAQQIKDAASRGVRICVASVPHRADNIVRALPELRGRVLAIDLDYWSRRDLLAIPTLGGPLLGLQVDSASLQIFATEAAGSPQLMQSICLWTCNHLGVRDALEATKLAQLDELARKEILFLTSCTVDFRSLVRSLISGPRVKSERRTYMHYDGRAGDVYLTVMRAIAMDPPLLAIDLDELSRRLETLTKGATPDRGHVARACAALGSIAASFAAPASPSLEWDEDAQTVVVPDPYLLFYLRWSVVLEREADALGG